MSSSTRKRIPTPTIGEILAEEFLEPLSISGYRLAKDLGVSTSSVLDLLHNRRRLSVEMSLRLARYFGNSEKFWLNLQSDIDLRNAREAMAPELKKIHPFKESA